MNDFDVLNVWQDHLIWCPSQCYYDFVHNGTHYCIYLRWRHSDPWTAELVKCDADDEFYDWEELDLDRDYSMYEYDLLKKVAMQVVEKKLNIKLLPSRWDKIKSFFNKIYMYGKLARLRKI